MGLQGALVDTAHLEWRAASGPRVHGVTPQSDQQSDPIKCRVSAPNPQELRTDAVQFTQYQRDVTILMSLKTTTGVVVDIDAEKRIVVESGPFAGTYEVMGDPKPIRAKRRMLAWEIAGRSYEGNKDTP